MTAMTDCLHLAASDIEPTADFARWCDANDPLAPFRDEFHIPTGADGRPVFIEPDPSSSACGLVG